jgi:hypothetical protein
MGWKEMNERIRELAEEAGAVFEKTFGLNDCPQDSLVDDEIQKFAELIVRECIKVVGDCSIEYATRPQIMEEIKEHFGVE